jgi:hypothetical protein
MQDDLIRLGYWSQEKTDHVSGRNFWKISAVYQRTVFGFGGSPYESKN